MSNSYCQKCGKPIGSNPECQTCIEYMVEQGASSYREDDRNAQQEAIAKGDEWMNEGRGKNAPGKLLEQVKLMWKMLNDYFSGDYKKIPFAPIATIIFAIIYAVNPIDLIPDFIPGIGWVDDIAVVGACFMSIKSHLKDYCIAMGLNPKEYGL